VTSYQETTDSPEFDEFFRHGDEQASRADSLHPVVEDGGDGAIDDEPRRVLVRTPEQVARRAKFIRLVSATMACLSIGTIGAFAHQAMAGHAHGPGSVFGPVVGEAKAVERPERRQVGELALTASPVAVAPSNVALQANPPQPVDQAGGSKVPAVVVHPDESRAQESVAAQQVVHAPAPDIAAIGAPEVKPSAKDESRAPEVKPSAKDESRAPEVKPSAKDESGRAKATTSPVAKAASVGAKVAKKSATDSTRDAPRPIAPATREKAAPARVVAAQPTTPKSESYHPPTASFAD
jgi:hypothetical protein